MNFLRFLLPATAKSRLLARNSAINIVGQGAPLFAAIFTYPFLISGLGEERFGALALAWLLTGYASIFDFGIGRALTQLVAKKLGTDDHGSIALISWTALLSMLATGAAAAIAMYLLAPVISNELLKSSPELTQETTRALRIISIFLPIVIITTGVRGILEAHQDFLTINLIRIPAGLMNYIGPLFVLPFSNDLSYIVAVLILARVLETLAYFAFCARQVPDLFSRIRFNFETFKDLLSFGSWMTVSNIIAPIMLSFDRFVIAGFLSLSAVAYYTTPYSMVTKLRTITGSVMEVLFPAFAEKLTENTSDAKQMYQKSLLAVGAFLIPPVVVTVIFAKPVIALWLSPEFAEQSFRVAQILALGVLVHGLGQPAFTLIQAAGKPSWTAKLHMLEVPFYIAYTLPLIQFYGIVGAAFAWVLRILISTIILNTIVSKWIFPYQSKKKVAYSHE